MIDFILFFFLLFSLFCIFISYSFAYLQKDIVFENYVNAIVNILLSILVVEGLYAWKLFDITCANYNQMRVFIAYGEEQQKVYYNLGR